MSGVVTVSRALTPRNWTSASDPTNGWDAADGVRVGDHWYNTTSGNVFVCVTNTVGAAVWRHIPRILGQSGAAVSGAADTAENTLATVSVPAGSMGVNGVVRVTSLWSYTNSANNKTLRVDFGGFDFLSNAATTTVGTQTLTLIRNRNATNSQVGFTNATFGAIGTTTGTATTCAVDTTAAVSLTLTGQKASAGETLTLESYTVELLRPDIT